MADLNVPISDLRTRITFQSPTITTDAGGAQSTTYANVGTVPTVWAQWINDHGQEAIAAEAVTSAQRATVRVRHRTDILETWRVVKDSENWQILSIDEVQDRNRWIEFRVERIKGSL
jgi:SPP1 family predicted phage head-tail adaptor